MKKLTLTFYFVFLALLIFAQTPQAFKYQAVVRNAEGEVLINQLLEIRNSIHDANGDGTINETDGIEQWYPFVGKTGYYGGDANMDIQVDNKDKNDIWVPNFNKSEILPE